MLLFLLLVDFFCVVQSLLFAIKYSEIGVSVRSVNVIFSEVVLLVQLK